MYQQGRLTLQEGEDWDHTRWRDVDNQLVFPDRKLLNVFWQAPHEPRSVPVHVVRLRRILIRWVDYGHMKSSGSVRLPCGMPHVWLVGRDNDLSILCGRECSNCSVVAPAQGTLTRSQS